MPFPFERSLFLKRGDRLKQIVADDLTTVFRVLRYIEGVGCTIEKDAFGYGWKIVVNRQSSAAPWDIISFDTDNANLELRTGHIEIHGENGTQYVTPSSMIIPLEEGDCFVGCDLSFDNAGQGASALFCESALPETDAEVYRKLLWKFTVEIVDNKYRITDSVRYCFSNVEYVGWRLD